MGVVVAIDDRLRLLMTVLAGSVWPEWEQSFEAHAVHPHAKQARRFASQFRQHPAVTGLNTLLEREVLLSDLFAAVLGCSWPDFEIVGWLPDAVDDSGWVSALAARWRWPAT